MRNLFEVPFRAMRVTRLDKEAAARDGPSSAVHEIRRTCVHVVVISEGHVKSGGDQVTPPELAKAPTNHGLKQMRAGNEFAVYGTPVLKSHVVQAIQLGRESEEGRCFKALNLKGEVSRSPSQETSGARIQGFDPAVFILGQHPTNWNASPIWPAPIHSSRSSRRN